MIYRRPGRKLIVLVLAGIVFALHQLGLLTVVVLTVSAVGAICAALGILFEIPRIRRLLARILGGFSRRLTDP